MWGKRIKCELGMRVGGCAGEACSRWWWFKGVRGMCRVIPSGLAQTRAAVLLAKIAVREVSSLLYSTATSRMMRGIFASTSQQIVMRTSVYAVMAYFTAYN